MKNSCTRCGKFATNDYGPLGILCEKCEKEPINAQQAAGCAVYFIAMFVFFGIIIWFLAHQ
jgi:hypothetical protein